MKKDSWKGALKDCFEKIRLIERCKVETRENFSQFCEFIAEPAFETLIEALKEYGIKAKFWRDGTAGIFFDISFYKSRATQFSYIIVLPNNSIQLKLELRLRGRKDKRASFKEWQEPFMPQIPPENVLTISKEEVIEDILNHYRDFMIEVLTSPR